MIKSKEEYYSILERLRTLNFNQKLGRNLQAKLEAFEEMEELVNLTIPVVVRQSEQLFCDCEIPKPTDPYDVVDKHICRDCKQIIAK